MSAQGSTNKSVPAVMIVGAGLGGLMLATLLEQVNIPYQIFERALEVRPLGSAMTLGPGIQSVFEQLGLWEDLRKMSLPVHSMHVYNMEMKELGFINLNKHKSMTGFEHLLFPRPELYKLMLQQVPAEKITMGKKVLRTEEKEGKIFIHCSDNTTYEGDILVGADGAYSGVRQSLYKRMDEQGLLPKKDLESFSIGYVTTLGVSKPKNPEKYPQLKDNFCHFTNALGRDLRHWTTISVPGNQICWEISIQLSEEQSQNQHFRNSEWGPESSEAMVQEFENEPCPWGGTMGDIMRDTPKDLISKVFLEEKLFKTWYHGRTVIMGDAAHKMSPSAGQGALNAMQDAVVLANCLYGMKDSTPKSIESCFQDYYSQRFSRADYQYNMSHGISQIMTGQTWLDRLLRTIILGYLPHSIQQLITAKGFEYRPQIAWLPLAHNRGTMKVLPQGGKRDGAVERAKAL